MYRILLAHTRHFYGGGDSTYNFNLANLLRKKGHEVCFFAMSDERNIPDPNCDLFVSNIDFRRLDNSKSLRNSLRVLRRAIYSSESRKKFKILLKRFKPDVLHLQNIHAHLTPSIIMEAKRWGLPVVWTLHDYKLICPNSHMLIDSTKEICEACMGGDFYHAFLKGCKKGSHLASGMATIEAYAHRLLRIKQRVQRFISPSDFLRGKCIDAGFEPEKVRHLPNFLPDQLFVPKLNDEGYILFMGRLEPIKGIYPLLEACKRAPNVRLVLAGRTEEPILSQLPALLPPNAAHVGMKHGEDLRNLLLNCRAVIVPSLWYENQPFSIIEAFGAGKPVIASDLGGMTELVEHQQRGLLAPPGDVDALSQCMRVLTEYPEEARRMGTAARQYAAEHHSPETHYKKLLEIYSELG